MTTVTQHEFDTPTGVCKYCGKDSKDATPTNCFGRSIQASTDLVEMVKKLLQIGQEEDRKRQEREEELKKLLQEHQTMLQERQERQEKLLQEQQTMLLLVAQSAMDPWGKTSTHRTESESKSLRNLVMDYYALRRRKRCQILMNLSPGPHRHVVNLHIWPEHAAASLSFHGLKPEDVNSPRNILRVNRAIERKFDSKDLTFELRENQLCLKVLNPAILGMKLEGSDQTFREVNRLPLVLPKGRHPFRRVLAAHSIQSHRLARAKGWINDHEQTDAQVQAEALARHSLDEEARFRLRRFLNLQDNKATTDVVGVASKDNRRYYRNWYSCSHGMKARHVRKYTACRSEMDDAEQADQSSIPPRNGCMHPSSCDECSSSKVLSTFLSSSSSSSSSSSESELSHQTRAHSRLSPPRGMYPPCTCSDSVNPCPSCVLIFSSAHVSTTCSTIQLLCDESYSYDNKSSGENTSNTQATDSGGSDPHPELSPEAAKTTPPKSVFRSSPADWMRAYLSAPLSPAWDFELVTARDAELDVNESELGMRRDQRGRIVPDLRRESLGWVRISNNTPSTPAGLVSDKENIPTLLEAPSGVLKQFVCHSSQASEQPAAINIASNPQDSNNLANQGGQNNQQKQVREEGVFLENSPERPPLQTTGSSDWCMVATKGGLPVGSFDIASNDSIQSSQSAPTSNTTASFAEDSKASISATHSWDSSWHPPPPHLSSSSSTNADSYVSLQQFRQQPPSTLPTRPEWPLVTPPRRRRQKREETGPGGAAGLSPHEEDQCSQDDDRSSQEASPSSHLSSTLADSAFALLTRPPRRETAETAGAGRQRELRQRMWQYRCHRPSLKPSTRKKTDDAARRAGQSVSYAPLPLPNHRKSGDWSPLDLGLTGSKTSFSNEPVLPPFVIELSPFSSPFSSPLRRGDGQTDGLYFGHSTANVAAELANGTSGLWLRVLVGTQMSSPPTLECLSLSLDHSGGQTVDSFFATAAGGAGGVATGTIEHMWLQMQTGAAGTGTVAALVVAMTAAATSSMLHGVAAADNATVLAGLLNDWELELAALRAVLMSSFAQNEEYLRTSAANANALAQQLEATLNQTKSVLSNFDAELEAARRGVANISVSDKALHNASARWGKWSADVRSLGASLANGGLFQSVVSGYVRSTVPSEYVIDEIIRLPVVTFPDGRGPAWNGVVRAFSARRWDAFTRGASNFFKDVGEWVDKAVDCVADITTKLDFDCLAPNAPDCQITMPKILGRYCYKKNKLFHTCHGGEYVHTDGSKDVPVVCDVSKAAWKFKYAVRYALLVWLIFILPAGTLISLGYVIYSLYHKCQEEQVARLQIRHLSRLEKEEQAKAVEKQPLLPNDDGSSSQRRSSRQRKGWSGFQKRKSDK
eukprot:g27331.t1